MKQYILSASVSAIVALLFIVGSGVSNKTSQQSNNVLSGLSERAIKATSLELATVGTTTVKLKSTTPSRGLCIETFATSSATTINLTLQASTTAVSASGIAWVPRYGTCR